MVVIDEGAYIQQSIAVGTSVVELSAEKNNLKRTEVIITNTSTLNQAVSLGIGQDAVSGVGITLAAGSTYVASVDAVYKPTNARITAVASAAGGSVSFYERSI